MRVLQVLLTQDEAGKSALIAIIRRMDKHLKIKFVDPHPFRSSIEPYKEKLAKTKWGREKSKSKGRLIEILVETDMSDGEFFKLCNRNIAGEDGIYKLTVPNTLPAVQQVLPIPNS